MAEKHLFITIRGKEHEWAFDIYADPKHIDDWRTDGIEVFEVENSIPEWVAGVGLTHVWCFFQDLFHFKNPFA